MMGGPMMPMEPMTTATGPAISPLAYLGLANTLYGLTQQTPGSIQVGSPIQGGQPIASQVQPWGANAMSSGLQGAMAGAMLPWGWPAILGLGALGYLGGTK